MLCAFLMSCNESYIREGDIIESVNKSVESGFYYYEVQNNKRFYSKRLIYQVGDTLRFFNSKQMTTYIYTLSDPRTLQVKYVGKTTNIKMRYYNHTNFRSLVNKRTHVSNWVMNLKRSNLLPILEIIDETTDDNWVNLEQYWISQFKCWGFDLCNHTGGGEGGCGNKWTDNQRKLITAAIKGKKRTVAQRINISKGKIGKPKSEKTKLKCKNSNIGKHKISEETRLKLSDSHKGIKQTKESIDKMKVHHYKPVDVFNINLELINSFKCMKDCAEYYNLDISTISKLIKNQKLSRCKKYFKLKIK